MSKDDETKKEAAEEWEHLELQEIAESVVGRAKANKIRDDWINEGAVARPQGGGRSHWIHGEEKEFWEDPKWLDDIAADGRSLVATPPRHGKGEIRRLAVLALKQEGLLPVFVGPDGQVAPADKPPRQMTDGEIDRILAEAGIDTDHHMELRAGVRYGPDEEPEEE